MFRHGVVLAATALAAACSSPVSPLMPTAPSAVAPLRRTLDLSGSWTGTYSIASCWPTFPNDCRWYSTPGAIALELSQTGNTLSGTLRTDRVGSMNVSGSVSDAGLITLTGEQNGPVGCFGITAGTGLVSRTDNWSAELTKGGQIAGTFNQYQRQGTSSCYTAMFEYRTAITSLTRTNTTP